MYTYNVHLEAINGMHACTCKLPTGLWKEQNAKGCKVNSIELLHFITSWTAMQDNQRLKNQSLHED